MKRLKSILTDDMDSCYFTGSKPVERHHVFGASNRKKSEKYGFIVPLSPTLHPNGVRSKDDGEIDLYLKQKCQAWYEANIGTRSDFIKEFGKNYL